MADSDRFDKLLSETAAELELPGDTVEETTPWRLSIGYIIAGLTMTSFTLNFLYLQYILPTVGTVLIYLGFRTLRRENGCFLVCHVAALLRLFSTLLNFCMLATPLRGSEDLNTVLTVFSVVTELLLLLLFRAGLRKAFRDAGATPEGDPLLGAVIWYVIMLGLALINWGGWIIGILMIISYIVIFNYLFHVSRGLEQWGYTVKAAPVRISGRALGWGYVLTVLAVVVIGAIGFSLPRTDFVPTFQMPVGEQRQAVEENLLGLGYPELALADLTEDEVLQLTDAVACSTSTETRWLSGRAAELTAVFTLLEDGRVFVNQYVRWENAPGIQFYKMEGIELWTHGDFGGLTGRLLCTKGGESYMADLDFRVESTDREGEYKAYSGFAYPVFAEDLRGYVFYEVLAEDTRFVATLLNYHHWSQFAAFPYQDVADRMKSSGMFSNNMVQSYFTWDTLDHRRATDGYWETPGPER
jgi:hypothetical protein